jgi:hypothetical protein
MPDRADDLHFYYVTQRGGRICPVFQSNRRRKVFVRAVAEEAGRSGLTVHGFAVLPRRYHLLVRANSDRLVPGLRRIIQAFTGWFNAMEGNLGPLLAARSTRIELEDDQVGEALVGIHYAPVQAGLGGGPAAREYGGLYPWSSYPYYMGVVEPVNWLDIDLLAGYVRREPPRSTLPAPPASADRHRDTGPPVESAEASASIDVSFEDSTVAQI